MFQACVSQPIQPSARAERIIFDIVSKKEKSGNKIPASPKKENTVRANFRLVIPDPRQSWKNILLTAGLGRVEDKSEMHEFLVYDVLNKSRTHIDNKFSLVEMLLFERVLYSQYYTDLYEHTIQQKQNVQPVLAPSVPSR
jgi:hypothetical protein